MFWSQVVGFMMSGTKQNEILWQIRPALGERLSMMDFKKSPLWAAGAPREKPAALTLIVFMHRVLYPGRKGDSTLCNFFRFYFV